jgi:macrolide transport system ATP-binding/permease protein
VWRKLGARLVVVELATAVVLLAGVGLIGKSLYLLMQVDTGIEADHLVTLELTASKAGYGTDPKIIALERQILSKVSAMPGVKTASISSQLPVSHNGNTTWFRVIGRPWHGEHNDVPERTVSATHFANIGARLLREVLQRNGRQYEAESDDRESGHGPAVFPE